MLRAPSISLLSYSIISLYSFLEFLPYLREYANVCRRRLERSAGIFVHVDVYVFPLCLKSFDSAMAFNVRGVERLRTVRPVRLQVLQVVYMSLDFSVLSPYREWRGFIVCSYISSVTAMPSAIRFGSPSKYRRRKMCLLTFWRRNYFFKFQHILYIKCE